jgi:hypothetical protein
VRATYDLAHPDLSSSLVNGGNYLNCLVMPLYGRFNPAVTDEARKRLSFVVQTQEDIAGGLLFPPKYFPATRPTPSSLKDNAGR